MAVGIDKNLHKRLMDSLSKLSADKIEPEYWHALSMDLEQAYRDTLQLIYLTENAAMRYNELQANTRTKMATELRSRKRLKT